MRRIAARPAMVLAVLALALSVRLAAGYWWQTRLPPGQRFEFGDSESYWVLAHQLLHGEAYTYGESLHIFRTPGYPLLLASALVVVGEDPPILWVRGLSAVFSTLAVGMVMALALALFDGRTALLAGTLTALYPGAISTGVFVLSEAPFCPLMLLQLLCWVQADRASVGWRGQLLAGCGGLAAGCATLVRPSWLLFTPFAGAIALAALGPRKRQAALCLTMLLGLALCLTPWWIRNYRLTGHFVATTLQMGASLYDGLHAGATGASDMGFVSGFYRQQQQADASATAPLPSTFEYRLDRRLKRAALEWAGEHPRGALGLALVKFARLWSPWPHAADMQSWKIRTAVFVGYTPLLLLGLWGALVFRRRGWPYVLCWLPALYLTCLHTVFVSSIRYREPAMLALIVLAAGVLTTKVARLRVPRSGGAGQGSSGEHRPPAPGAPTASCERTAP